MLQIVQVLAMQSDEPSAVAGRKFRSAPDQPRGLPGLKIADTTLTGILLKRVLRSIQMWPRITRMRRSSESEGSYPGNPSITLVSA
jgi:hypothetical protein